MKSNLSPCPNGGRCGSMNHDLSKSQYWKCARADAAETLLVHGWWELDDDFPEVFNAKTMQRKMES